MTNFEPKYKTVQKPRLSAKNRFNPTGLIAEKCRCFLGQLNHSFYNWFKLVEIAFKLAGIYKNALFNNWFKLLVSTGLTGLMRVYIRRAN